jgi:ABC-type phosphate/phosphonate transport system substrate-binding protein
MNIRSFRIVPVTVSVIMALATGCGTVSTTASAPARPDPELTDITVAALPDTRVLVTTAHSPIVAVARLVGKKIAVNGTNSIGTLLISVLLSDHGISPAKVRLITDPQGFPAMPARLQEGASAAAFSGRALYHLRGRAIRRPDTGRPGSGPRRELPH